MIDKMTAVEKSSLEAFLRARSKNHTEDVRLQRILSTFSLEKKQWERRIFNETFEQRHLAYALKKDADEIKKREKKKERRAVRLAVLSSTDREQIVELRIKMDSRKSGIVINTSGALPVLQGQDNTEGQEVNETKGSGRSDTRKETPTLLPTMSDTHTQPAPLRSITFAQNTPTDTGKEKTTMPEIFERLIPKSIRKARSMADLERLKCIDPRERELPPLDLGDLVNDDAPIEKSVLAEDDNEWIGNPKAIGSVRRPRLPPEVMSARSKNIGDVMKLIRDLPVYPSCSKNCNKPGAKFNEMLTRGDEKSMMPSLVNSNVHKYHQGRCTPNSAAIQQIQAALLSLPLIRSTSPQPVSHSARPQPHIIRSLSVLPTTNTERQVLPRDLPTR